jgi:hypothetical protein
MVDQNMFLLPTTFDHLGGLGPLAHRFFFGSPTHNPGLPLHYDTHSNACNIGSTTRNSLIEQPIGVLSMLAFHAIQ